EKLPAWQWGKRSDGVWGVIDANSAADADLWFSYVLLEAGRLWHEPRYTEAGRAMMRLIAANEVVDLPAGGPLSGAFLLPAPAGYIHGTDDDRRWRFNPSYQPLPILRRLAQEDAKGPWKAIAGNSVKLL